MKRNWLQRLPAVVIYKRSNTVGVVNTQPPTGSNIYETHKQTYGHKSLPVWLLCAWVREARQRDSSRLHTPTPQIQGPRSRILARKKLGTKIISLFIHYFVSLHNPWSLNIWWDVALFYWPQKLRVFTLRNDFIQMFLIFFLHCFVQSDVIKWSNNSTLWLNQMFMLMHHCLHLIYEVTVLYCVVALQTILR